MNDSFLMPEKIIKAGNQRNSSLIFGNLVKRQIVEAEERARRILDEVAQTAADTTAQAERESEDIRHQAYLAGRQEAEQELLEHLLAIKEVRAQSLQEVERDVLKLSVKIAEKIIGREVKQDENVRGEIVLNALRQARQQEMLTVRVNAADLPVVEQLREKTDSFSRAKYIDFVADQSVKEGGCIIESASGTIDARLETQLRILENALLAQSAAEEKF